MSETRIHPARKPALLGLVLGTVLCAGAMAWSYSVRHPAPPDAAALQAQARAAVQAHTQGQITVKDLQPSPVAGLYEVTTTEQDVFYVDASGRYGLADARLVDMKDRKDLTAARLDAMSRIDFNALPLHLAIKVGNGKKVLVVFEDATCPVCKPLHKFLMQVPDTTLYVFPYPVVSKDSMPIAGTAWCADDRAAAWQEAMVGAKFEINRAPRCDLAGLKEILDLGERLNIKGTPTVFLGNGQRLQGAVPPEQLLAALDASAQSAQARNTPSGTP